MFDDQQQQQPQNQIQPYGVYFGTRAKSRGIPYLPHVPTNIGAPNFRARQLPVLPVREQQQDVMLQDNIRVNQDMLQHNIQQQDNIAYNRRHYPDPQNLNQKRHRKMLSFGSKSEISRWQERFKFLETRLFRDSKCRKTGLEARKRVSLC